MPHINSAQERWEERVVAPGAQLTPSVFPDDARAVIHRPARSTVTVGPGDGSDELPQPLHCHPPVPSPTGKRKLVSSLWAGKRTPASFTIEPEILGTGGGIGNARNLLKGGTFVTANGDAIERELEDDRPEDYRP